MTAPIEASLGSDWKSKVTPLVYVPQMYTASGSFVGAGVGTSDGGSIWINQDLFDKYNVTPPTTMDEWVKDCAIFKQNGVTCFVQGVAQAAFDRDHLQVISNSIKPGVWKAASEGTAKWTDPTIVQALTVWKSLFTNGIMQPGAVGQMQFPDAQNEMFKGNTAMILMGNWEMQYGTVPGMAAAQAAAGVANPEPFVLVPIPYPSLTSTPNTEFNMFGDVDYAVAVNRKSDQQAAALAFAIWISTSAAGQQQVADTGGSVPALLSAKPNWDQVQLVDPAVQQAPIEKLYEAVGRITEPRLGILSQDMTNAVGIAAQSVGAGEATPEQAAAQLQATFDAEQ
jgi:ABC-type glycerol-3-phosphate transport system substrate-binding protein